MELKGKKILVTGADGFIGSHLVEALVKLGCRVRAFALYNSFNSWGWLDRLPKDILGEIEVICGDIRDRDSVKEAMKSCEVVMHLAALIAIPYSYQAPSSYVETNVMGTLNVVQAAKELGIEKVIHTSTSEVYGSAKFVPITEEHPLQPQSPYSASKIGADQIALSYYHSFGVPVCVIRPFNTYGPRQSARAVIPTVIMQLVSGLTTIKLGSIHPTRDFSYVTDTVQGFIKAAESSSSKGEVINLGSNFEVSIGETVKIIARLMNKEVKVLSDDARLRPAKSEVERLWSCNEKGKKLLGYKPEYDGLKGFERGLNQTIDWFSQEENLRFYKTDIYNV